MVNDGQKEVSVGRQGERLENVPMPSWVESLGSSQAMETGEADLFPLPKPALCGDCDGEFAQDIVTSLGIYGITQIGFAVRGC